MFTHPRPVPICRLFTIRVDAKTFEAVTDENDALSDVKYVA